MEKKLDQPFDVRPDAVASVLVENGNATYQEEVPGRLTEDGVVVFNLPEATKKGGTFYCTPRVVYPGINLGAQMGETEKIEITVAKPKRRHRSKSRF